MKGHMKRRTYSVGVNLERERLTITVNNSLLDIPFNVWRDLGQLAGRSLDNRDVVIFEFLGSNALERLKKAEEVLQGAMWVKEESSS